jgi:cytochrome b6-f complex iron-sulfur subunit
MRFSRRTLLDGALGASLAALGAVIAYPIVRFLTPPEERGEAASQVDAGTVDDPDFRAKGYKIVRLGSQPVIVVRVAEDEFRAFSATCTHLDCIVTYRARERLIWCNCHDGRFDLQGAVVGGPPPEPLARYAVHLVRTGTSGVASVLVSRERS